MPTPDPQDQCHGGHKGKYDPQDLHPGGHFQDNPQDLALLALFFFSKLLFPLGLIFIWLFKLFIYF